MAQPLQRCEVCGDIEIVKPDGRGFPPDIARRRLQKRCHAKGHACRSIYTPGLTVVGIRPMSATEVLS